MKKIFALMALVGLSSPVLAQDAPASQAADTGVATDVAGTEATGLSTATIVGTTVAAIATGAVLYSIGGDSTSSERDAGGGGDGGGDGGTGGTGGTGGSGGTGGTGG